MAVLPRHRGKAATSDLERQPAVRWLSPRQLWRTGREVASSSFFAKYADKRESEAATPAQAYDIAPRVHPSADFFVDYVADTGDGFNATYAVACSALSATTVIANADEPGRPLGTCTCERSEPGQLLVLGGDEVYPVASVRGYEERMKRVWQMAGEAAEMSSATNRYVVAVPGNHDWYDGLVAFRRNFCESWVKAPRLSQFVVPPEDRERLDRVGGHWRAIQSRSYFAVRLPHHWWIWGIDIQLDAPIDAAQLDYFRMARRELRNDPASRLMIATARPSWQDPDEANDSLEYSNRQNLSWFIKELLAGMHSKVRLVVAGDLHHYSRYAPVADGGGTQAAAGDAEADEYADPVGFAPTLVTCGGGGAFLSSTHHLSDQTFTPFWDQGARLRLTRRVYALATRHDDGAEEAVYPSRSTSAWLRPRVLLTPFKNDQLPLFVGALYLAMATMLAVSLPEQGSFFYGRLLPPGDLIDLLHPPGPGELWAALPFPLAVLAVGVLLCAFARYGAVHKKRRALVLGVAHTVLHALVLVLLAWPLGDAARWWHDGSLAADACGDSDDCADLVSTVGAVVGLGVFVVLAGLVGAFVLALYLFVCDLKRIGIHQTESFSSFRYEGYKSHLRIHVTEDALHVRAIGLKRVPNRWQMDSGVYVPLKGFWKRFGAVDITDRVRSEEIDVFAVPRDVPTSEGG